MRRATPRLLVLLGIAAAVTGNCTVASAATIPCSTRTTAPAFSPWSDSNDYFQAPGGGFEGSFGGWTPTGGVGMAAPGEPWKAFGTSNSALYLGSGSKMVSPTFCVGKGELVVRLFVKRPGVSGAKLRVSLYTTIPNRVSTISYTDIDGCSSGWTASVKMPIVALFQYAPDATTQDVNITLQPTGTAAGWLVDDVSVDPFKFG
jgi:hypothetical protein